MNIFQSIFCFNEQDLKFTFIFNAFNINYIHHLHCQLLLPVSILGFFLYTTNAEFQLY